MVFVCVCIWVILRIRGLEATITVELVRRKLLPTGTLRSGAEK